MPPGAPPVHLPSSADLEGDGIPETLEMDSARLSIYSGSTLSWSSPPSWSVTQAAFTDLDRNGLPEVTLLLWRPFQPWPVDAFLPHGGRIQSFQDGDGYSCHLILVGFIRGALGELWAGSALADPVLSFAAADLDGDLRQELVTLEGRYARHGSTPGRTLKVWEWNGFGFSVVSSVDGSFSALALASQEQGGTLVLTP